MFIFLFVFEHLFEMTICLNKQKSLCIYFCLFYFEHLFKVTIYLNKQKIAAQTCVYKRRPIEAHF